MSTSLPSQPRCPGAQYEQSVHGTPPGVRCRLTGLIQDAATSPCIGAYAGDGERPACSVWAAEKRRIAEHRHERRATSMVTPDGWKAA